MTNLSFEKIGYSIEDSIKTIDIQLDKHCHWVSVVGMSGVGKSTLLRSMLGLNKGRAGKIWGQSEEDVDRFKLFSYMSQENSLFPFLTLEKNLCLALHETGLSKKRQLERIEHFLKVFGLSTCLLNSLPSQISGGQRARFQLIRTLLLPRKIMLLDEAFSSLDEKIRVEISSYLKAYAIQNGKTVISVTHVQQDMKLLADSIIFLANDPRFSRQFSPREIESEILKAAEFSDYYHQSYRVLYGEAEEPIVVHPGNLIACESYHEGRISLEVRFKNGPIQVREIEGILMLTFRCSDLINIKPSTLDKKLMIFYAKGTWKPNSKLLILR